MMKQFLNSLAEVLDSENEITLDLLLDSIEEWDSLSMVSFAAMVDIKYNKQVKISDIKEAKTIRELYNLIDPVAQ